MADGDLELEFRVDGVGFVLAEVPGDAGCAQHRAAEAVGDGAIGGEVADVLAAGHEDLVLRQQFIDVADALLGVDEDFVAALDEVIGHFPREAADAEVGVHKAVAGDFLEELLDELALGEGVGEARAEDAGIDAEGAGEHEVTRQAVEFGEDDADVLGALGHLDVHEALDGHAVGLLGVELGEVLGAVGVADALAEVHRLHELLAAAVHVADVGDDVDDLLAGHDEHHAEHAVGARVLGAHIDGHVDDFGGVVVDNHPIHLLRLRPRAGCRPATPRSPAGGCPCGGEVVGHVVGQQDGDQVRVPREVDAEHVAGLALVPVCGGVDVGDAGHVGVVVGHPRLHGELVQLREGEEVVDDFEAFLLPVDAAEAAQEFEVEARVVVRGGHDGREIIARHFDGDGLAADVGHHVGLDLDAGHSGGQEFVDATGGRGDARRLLRFGLLRGARGALLRGSLGGGDLIGRLAGLGQGRLVSDLLFGRLRHLGESPTAGSIDGTVPASGARSPGAAFCWSLASAPPWGPSFGVITCCALP